MRDEHFDVFIERFGDATAPFPALPERYEVWETKLPKALLDYWRDEGWSGYANGLFWIVDPAEYEDIIEEWLHETPLPRADQFHVIARTAFGKLYLWGERSGGSARIIAYDHSILCLQRDLQRTLTNPDLSLKAIFSGRTKADADTLDIDGRPLFERAVKMLGPIGPDEMYGFEPALILGGKMALEHLRIVKTKEHLGMLRQLSPPTFPMGNISIEKLLRS